MITKMFPATDVLTLVSGRMVGKRGNTDVVYDLAEFVLNDSWFSEEARAGAPRLVAERMLEVADQVAAELDQQFPYLKDFPIPERVTMEWIKATDKYFGDLEVKQLIRVDK